MLITRARLARLGSVATTQVLVQAVGFLAGILLVRHMAQAEYGYYTLAVSMVSIAIILSDLGLATAVMAIGGSAASERTTLGRLIVDADAVHRRLTWLSLVVLVPCFAFLLARQHAPLWQVLVLTFVIVVTAVFTARGGMALSIARVLGHLGVQQKLDLAINIAKLGLLMVAVFVALDATIACLVNLVAAAVYAHVLRRHLKQHVDLPPVPAGEHQPALERHVRRQAPNSVYFVLSSQLALWLIGMFGSAERVAEAGALGRLAALFTVITAVSASLVLPYFARRESAAELAAGFAGVNLFYGALLVVLVAAGMAMPQPILWVLGGHYAGLHDELVWMLLASALTAWGGAIYTIGCARGWVMPAWLGISTGIVATVSAAALVDVSTVRGSFMINASTGLVGTVVALGYFSNQLRRHARGGAPAKATP